MKLKSACPTPNPNRSHSQPPCSILHNAMPSHHADNPLGPGGILGCAIDSRPSLAAKKDTRAAPALTTALGRFDALPGS
jgi:hypothetical protein